ncbi:MAG: hypothetical protein GX095_01040 [Clostridiales bacterium]|nr:hypothetical protein [Clostridiales bacterium]
MVIKLLKKINKSPEDVAILSPINELICKVACLDGGYYLYNKTGDQIAQIIFEGNTAYLSVSSPVPVFPASIKMVYEGGCFAFLPMEVAASDREIIANIKNKKDLELFSLRGDPAGYSYDVYLGNKVYSNVVPSSTDKKYYLMRLAKDANLLKALLISLAIDYYAGEAVPNAK